MATEKSTKDVEVKVSEDSHGNKTVGFQPPNTSVDRGPKMPPGAPTTYGDTIRYTNSTEKDLTLTFFDDETMTGSSIAQLELNKSKLTISPKGNGTVTVTGTRFGKGDQGIWTRIESELAGSGPGGGPDMGIKDPK